ncbi:conserved hypothetical protein [Acidimicrobium ferrooxidans DSM 10331]|uniref:Prepilin type IV endopeptidase peptidase domain-containing protein n=1 Tax=Acidimicrobium ferrooxidans (strain DSM 10331 / JCM 15462 / NBRC 103882 / ICP) TaxID=525909 RepID=C7M0X7_ACIFD|nr:A24 family peptidase [Acidimicrobium ferrooxidans]ACU54635.1 conserved hypothetical protein [Acidimicrobium ferrooxidans DSM 10331]
MSVAVVRATAAVVAAALVACAVGPLARRRGAVKSRRATFLHGGAGVAAGLGVWWLSWSGVTGAALVAEALAWSVAVVGATVDWQTRRIPRSLVDGALVTEVVIFGLGPHALRAVAAAIGGALAVVGAWMLVRWLSRGGLGRGDIALLGMLGAVEAPLGWWVPVLAALVALSLGALGALWHLLRGGSHRDRLPLGPAIAVGALVALIVAHGTHVSALGVSLA